MHWLLMTLTDASSLLRHQPLPEPELFLPVPLLILTEALWGVLLIVGRHKITNLFAYMLRSIHLPAGPAYHRLGHATCVFFGAFTLLAAAATAAVALMGAL